MPFIEAKPFPFQFDFAGRFDFAAAPCWGPYARRGAPIRQRVIISSLGVRPRLGLDHTSGSLGFNSCTRSEDE